VGRLGSSADEIRALVPDALASWRYIREEVIERGVVDQRIKELCYRYLANDPEVMDLARFDDPERAALEWADAIAYQSDRAGDELWARLNRSFSEAELVDLGCAIGFELGQQHWRRSVGLSARD
jgi:alkylhydroperoxidase family enzyme